MKPNDSIINTDYGSLLNDSSSTTISLTVPNNYVYNPSNPLLAQTTIEVGTNNAYIRARGSTSKFPGWYTGTFIASEILTDVPSIPGSTFTGFLFCSLDRVSPTSLRLSAYAEGVSGAPDYRTRESQTITFVLSTFLSPIQ